MLKAVWVTDQKHLIEATRSLFIDYQQELGIDLCFQGFQDELTTLPGKYSPPTGALLLVLEEERAIACGAIRSLGDDVAEMKRLYVAPDHRNRSLGRAIATRLVDKARELGYAKMRLDTLARLRPAVQLYERMGFYRIEPYNQNPEADICYMEKLL